MKTNRKTDSNTENTKKSDGKITLKKIIGHFKTLHGIGIPLLRTAASQGFCFRGCATIYQSTARRNLSRARGFTAETGVRTKRNAHFTDIRRRGCIIKAETDIILNIGLIIM